MSKEELEKDCQKLMMFQSGMNLLAKVGLPIEDEEGKKRYWKIVEDLVEGERKEND